MNKWVMQTEEEFEDYCECAYGILNFLDTITTDVRWWFNKAYHHNFEDRYTAIFTSYATDEYKDYILSIEGKLVDGNWQYRVVKKVDGLTK